MCVSVCVCVCVRVCAWCKTFLKLRKFGFLRTHCSSSSKKPPNQKFEETYISNTIKIAPFQEGGLKKKNLVGANTVEMEYFHCYVNVVNYKDIYVL